MGEAVGLASGLLALGTFALQSSITLYETVKSFQSYQQRIHDFLEEIGALGGVLESLTETIKGTSGVDFSALKTPLLRCGTVCKDFEKEILRCSSRSGGSRTSFRDWAKLRYMGEDIDGFRRLLAGYKLTICVALTDANLRNTSVTAESIKAYNDLLNTARAGLEDRLETIDEKLELILGQSVAGSESDVSEVGLIKEERLSTEKCLQICSQLSDHISRIQLAAQSGGSSDESVNPDTSPEKITNEGLQECKRSLAGTALKLEGYEKLLFDRLMEKSKTAIASEDERADLARLRDEWEATRQGIEICSKAHDHLKESASTIDNYATGDAVQFMVSTNQKTIHGTNRGLGWRTRQVGGHLSDDSLQQIVKVFGSTNISSSAYDILSSRDSDQAVPGEEVGEEPESRFKDQYGRGFNLTSRSALEKLYSHGQREVDQTGHERFHPPPNSRAL